MKKKDGCVPEPPDPEAVAYLRGMDSGQAAGATVETAVDGVVTRYWSRAAKSAGAKSAPLSGRRARAAEAELRGVIPRLEREIAGERPDLDAVELALRGSAHEGGASRYAACWRPATRSFRLPIARNADGACAGTASGRSG